MTLVTGTVQDLGYDGMEGTLWARPARFRSDGQVVYAPERKPYKITGGVVSAELAPGPAVLELQVGSHARGTFEVVIPDADTTLADLLDTVFPWEPAQVSLFVAVREAAEQAKADAETAAQQAGQDRAHVDSIRETLDEAAQNNVAPYLTQTALNATYAADKQVPSLAWETVTLTEEHAVGTNPVPVDVIDGVLYGFAPNALHRTTDPNGPWEHVQGFNSIPGGVGGAITGLRPLGNGEVLAIKASAGLFVSSGWATNPLTATWTQTLPAPVSPEGSSWFLNFGVDVRPELGWVFATTYQAGNGYGASRWAWLSKDYGQTWTEIFDFAEEFPHKDADAQHMHAATIEYRPGVLPVPRLWISLHDIGGDSEEWVMVSDDEGGTWHIVGTDGTPGDEVKPTTIGQAEYGMVMASDNYPNGINLAATALDKSDLVIRMGLGVRRDRGTLLGWGGKYVTVDGVVFTAFTQTPQGYAAPVFASNGLSVSEFLEVPCGPTETVQLSQIMVWQGQLLLGFTRDGVEHWALAPIPRRATARPQTLNSGGVLGGLGHDGSVAAGVYSKATAFGTIALGVGAEAGSSYSTVIGHRASGSAADSYGVAVGAGAQVQQGVSIGHASKSTSAALALGRSAEALGSGTTVVGNSSKVPEGGNNNTLVGSSIVLPSPINSTTIIGSGASATSTFGTAIGSGASTAQGVAVGAQASALGTHAVVLGRGATVASNHGSSIALGYNTATTATGQVAVGARNLTMLNSSPNYNVAGGGYLYVEGGALKFRGSAGTVTEVAPA